jgi:hypothetical protein
MALTGLRMISKELTATGDLTSTGAKTVATLPAQTVILAAGVEVTEALAGATALTFDLGTGADDDEFVAAYALASKTVGAVAPSLPGIAYIGSEDTLDVTVDTLTGTATAGKIRVWALVADVDGKGADEVDRDLLA